MLGKGLESLIPSPADEPKPIGSASLKDAAPPSDLPVLEPPPAAEVKKIEPKKPAAPSPPPAGGAKKDEKKSDIFYIEVDKVVPNPSQPRRNFPEESIKELAASIREFGLLQPIVVSKVNRDTPMGADVEYELIAGERRLRAVRLLGLHTIPAMVRDVNLERERLELAVIENIQRENLNPVEAARAFSELQDKFRMTQREIAARLGKSRETVANTMRLLTLPQHIQLALAEGKITESHGRFLLALAEPAAQQRLFEELLRSPMTTRELKNRVRSLSPEKKTEEKPLPPELRELQEKLSSELGAPVIIEQHPPAGGQAGGGKITIRFYSPEELRNIVSKLAKEEEL